MKSYTKPVNKREKADEKKSFARTEKMVKPVAKDTNKTRRKIMKPSWQRSLMKKKKLLSIQSKCPHGCDDDHSEREQGLLFL